MHTQRRIFAVHDGVIDERDDGCVPCDYAGRPPEKLQQGWVSVSAQQSRPLRELPESRLDDATHTKLHEGEE